MTREDAIQVLKEISATLKSWEGFTSYPQALDMAIEALSADAQTIDICDNPQLSKTDLISRADAMSAVQDHFNSDGFKGYDDGQKMMDRIKTLPSADAVSREEYEELYRKAKEVNGMANDILADFPSYKELVSVVRCKDCRYWTCKDSSHCHNNHLCNKWNNGTSADDFCSYGERREP